MGIEYVHVLSIMLLLLMLFVIQFARQIRKGKSLDKDKFNITITESTVYLDRNGLPKINLNSNSEVIEEVVEMEEEKPVVQNPDERRRHPREAASLPVDFVSRDHLFKEVSKDISASGMFLKTSAPQRYKVGDLLTLAFHTLAGTPKKCAGKIVRTTDQGFGVSFLEA